MFHRAARIGKKKDKEGYRKKKKIGKEGEPEESGKEGKEEVLVSGPVVELVHDSFKISFTTFSS